jgi:hypothetical protein
MKFITLIVTRSESCHVKTLHTILRFNLNCVRGGHNNEIIFVDDNVYEKQEAIQQCMKKDVDRILFIDFGIHMDHASIEQCLEKHEGCHMLVFPGVLPGVDWKQFKEKVQNKIDEPKEQYGLNFDTAVNGQKLSENIHGVHATTARAWLMMVKPVKKKIDKIHSKEMFQKMKDAGVKIYAYTAAKLTMTYAHECVSNILSAAGVKATA